MPDCMEDNSCYCQVIWEVTLAIVKTYLSGDLFMQVHDESVPLEYCDTSLLHGDRLDDSFPDDDEHTDPDGEDGVWSLPVRYRLSPQSYLDVLFTFCKLLGMAGPQQVLVLGSVLIFKYGFTEERKNNTK